MKIYTYIHTHTYDIQCIYIYIYIYTHDIHRAGPSISAALGEILKSAPCAGPRPLKQS